MYMNRQWDTQRHVRRHTHLHLHHYIHIHTSGTADNWTQRREHKDCETKTEREADTERDRKTDE